MINDIYTSHGGFVVPHTSLLPFLQEAFINMREFINDKNARHYPNNIIKMAKKSVQNNEELKCLFMDCIEELDLCDILDSKSMYAIFAEFLSKAVNISINDFLQSEQERDVMLTSHFEITSKHTVTIS